MFKIFRSLKKREWLLFAVGVIFIITQVWLDLKLPDYMSQITRLVQTPGSKMSDIIHAGSWMLLCAFGSLAAAAISTGIAAKIATSMSARLRGRVFNQVQAFSMREINNFSTDSLITRCTNDITQIQTFVAIGLQLIIKSPIMALWAIVKIRGKSWQWSVATVVAVIVLILVIAICVSLVVPRFKILQGLTDNLNRVTRENIVGIRVVRAYNAEAYEEKKFANANNDLTQTSLFNNRVLSVMLPSITLIMNGLSLSIYWIGAALLSAAAMTDRIGIFADMVVFSSYAMQVVISFVMLVGVFMIGPRAIVSARRVSEVIETPLSLMDGDKEHVLTDEAGKVVFKNVSFKYPDANEYAIQNINFTANKGETIAIIGATGCGKTTLINLIPRFFDTTEGEVLVGGMNVKEYKQESLRNLIGYVSQRAVLFEGDITSNIVFGKCQKDKITSQEILEAADVAQAAEFIERTEGGYKAHVAQGGTNFSGGQKQRLSIARALVRQPEILIFDDSFSALDYKTDRKLRGLLKEKTAGTTLFIVAQRIGTIKDADKIIVLADGKIAGIGKHEELMKSCDAYQEIAYSQLSKEELANG